MEQSTLIVVISILIAISTGVTGIVLYTHIREKKEQAAKKKQVPEPRTSSNKKSKPEAIKSQESIGVLRYTPNENGMTQAGIIDEQSRDTKSLFWHPETNLNFSGESGVVYFYVNIT